MKRINKIYFVLAVTTLLSSVGANAVDTQLSFTDAVSLSDAQSPDLGDAFKTKLVRLGNGTLVSTFGDGVDTNKIVYDLKGDVERPARDIFVRTCATVDGNDCSVEENWSEPENVSGV